ncbi:hypothetical protein MROS_1605 [Melioribacter roseus P3M-2]|uniref:Lipoprotein n=1 Tax=Melioribacter roseus (strain DSM 23840 / JCM 17771 / VKM B-2668 / P3M-2) TaxID=1191523 RepID=I6ZS00_MELRP|nr:hypothetical protein [Melioribacter roseus]AFN74839.1 hypothetical protein MROS_1605 [Melioribacter roseus P3M-2]
MKVRRSYLAIPAAILFFALLFAGCNDNSLITEPESGLSVKAALEKITYEDEAVNSFEPNFNEEDAMNILGKDLAKTIYPLRVGQVIHLVERDLQIEYGPDTALGTLTKRFEGELLILGALDDGSNVPDTLVKKPFTTVMTRKIKYERVDSTGDNLVDWKVIGMSLPEAGTSTDNIEITKITLTTLEGNSVTITSPNDFFFDLGRRLMTGEQTMTGGNPGNGQYGGMGMSGNQNHGNRQYGNGNAYGSRGMHGMIPYIRKREPVTITVEVKSIYEEPDFLTVTHGASVINKGNRVKERFELIDTQFDGAYYIRTYEKTIVTNAMPGFMHAVVNMLPQGVIKDTDTPVEEKTWGIPYLIQ